MVLLHQWHCPPIILCKHKSLWLEFVYLLPRVLHVPLEHTDPGVEQRPLVLSRPEFSLTSHLLPKSSGGAGNSVSSRALRATWRWQESEIWRLETCSAALESLTAHQLSKCKTPRVTLKGNGHSELLLFASKGLFIIIMFKLMYCPVDTVLMPGLRIYYWLHHPFTIS